MSEIKKLSSYFHFREAIDLKNKTLLEKADLEPSLDFLDSLEYDIPRGNKQAMSFRMWDGLLIRAVDQPYTFLL